MRRHRLICMVVLLSCSVLAPAGARAGSKVSKGGISLELRTTVTPHKAGATGVSVHVHIEYDFSSSTTREHALAKEVRFALAPGMRIDPAAAGQCSDASIIHNDGVSGCHKSSIVGSGTIVVDARPAIPTLLDGRITLYNVKQGSAHYVLFWFTVSPSGKPVSVGELFRILAKGDATTLDYRQAPPEAGATALYTPRTIDFTIHHSSGHRPYIDAPDGCAHSWPFSVRISAYGGAPTLDASAHARCS
jgi:hypothetical protein